jgi:ribosome-associated heat shock protein Hsp15
MIDPRFTDPPVEPPKLPLLDLHATEVEDSEEPEESEETPAGGPPAAPPSLEPVRVDKWLWAARCFKTRTAASEACDGGHVKVNGTTARAAQKVRPGDEVEALSPAGRRVLRVRGTAERRGSPAVALSLFEDLKPIVREPRDPFFEVERGAGRPSKRDRRAIDRLKGWG